MIHPLIPPVSSRLSLTLQDSRSKSVIPNSIPQKSFEQILARHPLTGVQGELLRASQASISASRILLKRNLNYNLRHRRLRYGACECSLQALRRGQEATLANILNHLWQRKIGSKSINQALIGTANICHPPLAFFPLRIVLDVLVGVKVEDTRTVTMRCAVVPGLKSTETTEWDRAIVEASPVVTGQLDENGEVIFHGNQGFCLRRWGPGNRLVVKIDGLAPYLHSRPIVFRRLNGNGEMCNFGRPGEFRLLAGLKSSGPVEFDPAGVPDYNAPIPKAATTAFEYVFLYQTGSNFQIREMAVLRTKFGVITTTCIMCGMLCSGLVSLLRHLEGMHPGVAFEYDSQRAHLYFWFAPDKELIRRSVPGFRDNNLYSVKSFYYKSFSLVSKPYHRAKSTRYDAVLILDWYSRRYLPDLEDDILSTFTPGRFIDAYGIPIDIGRQKFVHMHGIQTCRPNQRSLHNHDSDEENDFGESDRRLQDIVDVSQLEKRFMSLWNRFLANEHIYTWMMMATLESFVAVHGTDIEMMDCYPLFVAHVVHLQRSQVISQSNLRNIMRFYRQTVRI